MMITDNDPKPNFALLASGLGWHVQDLKRAAVDIGIHLSVALFQDLSINIHDNTKMSCEIHAGKMPLHDKDAILVRMMPPSSLERVVFRMDMLNRLHESGVPVFNPPRTIEMAVDKALSLSRLAAAGIIVPRTWVGESPDEALIAFEQLGSDVVCKPIFGSEGRGIIRLQSRELAWRAFHTLSHTRSVIYLQQFIESNNTDYRLMYLNGDIPAAMRRKAHPLDWRANVAQGGKAEHLRKIDPQLTDIAIKTAQVTGGMMLGIDIIQSCDGHVYVLEVNGVPGWRTLSAVSGLDIAAEWLKAVKSEVCQ